MTHKRLYRYPDYGERMRYSWDYNNMLKGVDYEIGIQDFTRTASGRLLCRTYSPNARRVEVSPEPFIPPVFRAASWGGVIGGGRPTPSLPIIYHYHKYGHNEYTDEQLTRINTSTGYRDSEGTHVYVRDWQGNVRDVVSRDGGTTVFDQTTYYYPYGLPMAESTEPQANPYKYTAKELLTDQSLNLADHGARMYDPAMARWISQDAMAPLRSQMSPYIFSSADPINRIDMDGNWDVKISASPDRGNNPYAIYTVTDMRGNTVYQTVVKVRGEHRDRTKTNGDTPTGKYKLLEWRKTGNSRYPAIKFGPDFLLATQYLEGEVLGRDYMHTHGGRRQQPELADTQGCQRMANEDIVEMKEITDALEEYNPEEHMGYLIVENDLEKPVNYSDREMVKDSWTLNGGELPELIVTLENGSQTELDI